MDTECICKGENYVIECPYTFDQGGSRFHCLGGDLKAVRTDSMNLIDSGVGVEKHTTGQDGLIDMLKYHEISAIHDSRPIIPDPLSLRKNGLIQMEKEKKLEPRVFDYLDRDQSNPPADSRNLSHDDAAAHLLASNRATLKRFEALQLNGKSINDYTIGGFKLNLEKTTEKVKDLAPLPPNALPKIFLDDDLNFYHHFFKGMEILLGGSKFQEIVDSRIHHRNIKEDLPAAIIKFMESGMCVDDSSLTILVKKVLSSTFEKSVMSSESGQVAVLRVETNLWGFRYIEPGMVLLDADIKMWLSNCYSHYRTIWFDTFKSSGVPGFAVEGVIVNTTKPMLKTYTEEDCQRITQEYSDMYYRQLTKSRPYKKRSSDTDKGSKKSSWY